MQISKGSDSDSSHLIGRVSRIEALLSQFQVLEVVADIFGRGRWRMDALVRPSSTEQVEGTVAMSGAFYSFVTVTEGAGVGDIHLQGGAVNGQGVATTDLKLYDASSETWQGTADQHLYLSVAGTGTVADGVLLPGFAVSGITKVIGAPPGDIPPTKDVASGTAILSLGVFFDGGFLPAIAGNRNVAVCIGTFVKSAGA